MGLITCGTHKVNQIQSLHNTVRFLSYSHNMDVEGTAWYAVAVGSAFALLVVIRIPGVFGLRIDRIRWLWRVRYPVCQRALPWLSTANLCFLAACVAGNALSIVVSSNNVEDIARKSAVAASINLVPVFAIGSTGSIAGYLGLSTETSVFLHGCFGGLSIGCGIAHFIILTQIPLGSTQTIVSGAMVSNISLALCPKLKFCRLLRCSHLFWLSPSWRLWLGRKHAGVECCAGSIV